MIGQMTDKQIDDFAQKIQEETIDMTIMAKGPYVITGGPEGRRLLTLNMVRLAQKLFRMDLEEAKEFVEKRCKIMKFDEPSVLLEQRRAGIR